jgi:hypothetical protein
MNCRDSESLILAERDGALTKEQLAALSDHVAACPACRQLRTNLAVAIDTYRAGLDGVAAPEASAAWRDLQGRMHAPAQKDKRRPLAPVVWFAAPLAAAAALAFALIIDRPAAPVSTPVPAVAAKAPAPYDSSVIAGADFVEAGDPDASTLVYVDKESGWLVVWASSAESGTSG